MRETYYINISSQLQNTPGFIATYQTKSIVHLQTEKWEHSTQNLCIPSANLPRRKRSSKRHPYRSKNGISRHRARSVHRKSIDQVGVYSHERRNHARRKRIQVSHPSNQKRHNAFGNGERREEQNSPNPHQKRPKQRHSPMHTARILRRPPINKQSRRNKRRAQN